MTYKLYKLSLIARTSSILYSNYSILSWLWPGGYAWGVRGFKRPLWIRIFIAFFLLACLLERSVMSEDTPTPCLENRVRFFLFFEKKVSEFSPPPPPHPTPPPLREFFKAGAATRPAFNCKTIPLKKKKKSCVRHWLWQRCWHSNTFFV